MQFRIHTPGATPDLDAIGDALTTVDPAALVDLDAAGETVRIAATIGDAELVALVRKAGLAITPDQLERVPSECCGGCGG